MRPGQESKTAVLVCMSRALADSDVAIPWFSDATAFAFLPDDARARVMAIREGVPTQGAKDALFRGYLLRQARVMAARTETIDDVVRSASPRAVVLLGAGLDGRAFRLHALSDLSLIHI